MRTLIPQFILRTDQEADQHGTLEGPALFLDISGFTQLTSALMEHGDDGAEVLSGIINTLFDPLIKEIDETGGFISTFAGDALTAVFPGQEIDRVAHAAQRMQRIFDENHLQRTPAGEFAVEAKIGLGYGAIEWGTIHRGGTSTYYFRGAAIDEAAQAEHRCNRGEVLLGPSGVDAVGNRLSLQSSADGFGKVARGASQAEDAQDNLAKLSAETQAADGLDEATLKELHERYVPVGSLPTQTEGEFRGIAAVFVSVSAPATHEETADLVRPVLDLADEYGGYFNLLDFGDKGGVMLVLFGAPTAQGDDLHRATDFSLALSAALGERGRVGFASGTVFAGYVGNRDRSTYTALGATVNLSARLAMDAEWGTAVTAGEAAERLQARNSLTEVYRRRFKGFEAEMPVYTVSGSADVARQETPFVGRDSQIERLRGVIEGMLQGNERAHYVLGEAGVGKSRLVHRTVEGADTSATTVFLESDTILRKSMNSLPRLVRSAFELADIDVDSMEGVTAMGKLVEWLEAHEVSQDTTQELRRTRSGLLALLGPVASDSLYAQLDPQARFELTASAFQALVAGLSVVTPLLIVVDNAHALDADTRNIFSRLVAGSSESHFGVIFIGRGTPSESPFGIEEAVSSERLTSVKGLSSDEIREVTANIIEGPVDESLVDFILHRVGTNPLYVIELGRYLVDHRLLTQGESGYRVSTEDVSLPTEINALLVARVDSLPTHLKEAAQAAAVLGAEFDPVVLEKLVNAGPEFQKTLDAGSAAGLWRPSDDGRYRFEQDLVRQAMEEMQLSATLKRFHARASTLLQQLHPDDPSLYADLAYHYMRADMPKEAREALRKAADYALENFKNEKALEFLTSYQQYAASLDDRIQAYQDTASIYELTGRWQEATDTLTYAVGLTVVTSNLAARARLLASMGEIYRKQSENATAIRILTQARQLAKHEKDLSTYAEALIYLGRSYWARGDYATALKHFDEALETSTQNDNLQLEGLALYYQGVVYQDRNSYDQADSNFRRSYDIFEQIGDDRLSTYPLYNLGIVRLYQGQIDEAKDYFQRALGVYQRIGYQSGASAATLNLGVLRDRRGDFNAAIRYYQEAREIAEHINEHMAIGYTLFSIGATYYKVGDNRKSLAYLKDAFRILKRLGAKGYYGYVLSYLVSLFARTGNAERAIRTAYQHTQVVSQIGSDPENGRAVMSLASALEKGPKLSRSAQEMLKGIAQYYKMSEISPAAFFQKAIEISDPPKYVDTLIPAHFHYAEFLRSQEDEEGFRSHLKTAFELAVDAHWDRFVRKTRANYSSLLQEMGVNTDVETEDFEVESEEATIEA